MPTYVSATYLFVSVIIGLGAFGHGSQGRISLEPAFAAAAMAPQMAGVIRIVWYFASGCMLAFGALSLLSWLAATRGVRFALVVPSIIAVLYLLTGIAAFAYQHDPFWLLFVVEGTLLLASTPGLRRMLVRVTPANEG